MNLTGINLKEYYEKLTRTGDSWTTITEGFNQSSFFYPHNISISGPWPMVFSFELSQEHDSYKWIEIKDGYVFLLHFLSSDSFKKNSQKYILPKIARHFLPVDQKEMYYSCFVSDLKAEQNLSQAYALLDYFEGWTSDETIASNSEKIKMMASKYSQVNIVLNYQNHLKKDLRTNSAMLLNAIRLFPENINFYDWQSFHDENNFQKSRFYFLLDKDFVSSSPLTSLLMTQNISYDRPELIDEKDTLVVSHPVAPRIKKCIYKHQVINAGVRDKAVIQELNFMQSKIKKNDDYFSSPYRKFIADITKNLGDEYENKI